MKSIHSISNRTLGLCISLLMLTVVSLGHAAAKAPIIPAAIADTAGEIPMPDNLSKPLKVGVSLILNDIINLDEKNGVFEAGVDLSLSWQNPNLVFDPKVQGTNLRTFDAVQTKAELKRVWSPNIVISNIQKIVSDEPSMMISPDGSVVYNQRIKAQFKITPDLRSFPFDSQRLTFYLDAPDNTSSEVQFTQTQQDINSSGVRSGVTLSGWTMQDITFSRALVKSATGGFYSRYEAQINMKRISWPHLFAFAPLILIIFSPTIVALYNQTPNVGSAITAWGGSLLALIATMFALNSKYPALESDSILPQIINIILGYQFFMIIMTITIINPGFTKRFKDPYIASELISFLRWAIPAALVVLILMRILLAVA